MDIKKTAPKPPSRLLTDYYGAVFFFMVLIFLLAATVVLKPMLDDVKATNAQVVSTLAALDNETAYVNSLDQSISAAQTIPPNILEKVDQAMPRKQEIPELLVLFGTTADRDGVKIANVSFADAAGRVTTSSVGELTINMTVMAENYPQIKKFIRDLEASLRILDIDGINVSTQGTEGAESAYALQMKTYMYSPRPTGATPIQR
ncbi:MAG: type 4a pilus biogenesis protein PilO [Patescibacteria group bacterium]|jgi:Tfp pilus assembly protein PilO